MMRLRQSIVLIYEQLLCWYSLLVRYTELTVQLSMLLWYCCYYLLFQLRVSVINVL